MRFVSLFNMSGKILLIRLTSIGDVVHVLPALNALRTAYPDAQIDWMVEENPAQLLIGHPQINNLYIFRRKWRREFRRYFFSNIVPFFKKIRSVKYDWAIDFQGLTKSGLAAYFSGASRIIGFGDEDGRELNKLFTNVKVRPSRPLHIVEKNLTLLQPLKIENPPVHFVFPDFSREKVPFDDDGYFVAVSPGAGWSTKRLPLTTLARLCALLHLEKGLKIIIVWGPGEESLEKELSELIKSLGARADVAPPTTIQQLVRLISRAGLFIGGDTGPTHIAAALNVPVLSFFGASDARRNRPYGRRCIAIQKYDISCVPCWKTRCRYKDSRRLACLASITPEELFRAAESLVDSGLNHGEGPASGA